MTSATLSYPGGAPQSPLPDVDLLRVEYLLDPAERARLAVIKDHLQTHVRKQSIDPWNREHLPTELLPALARLGLGNLFLDGSSRLFQGLVHSQIARADVSLSALIGIHNELIVGTISELGSEEHKARWLPGLSELTQLGAFCLTEPAHGSDIAGGLATTATLDGDEWVIQGEKRWIGAGTVAALALVWARDTADGAIKCFAVDTAQPGYSATKIANKMGLRIMQNADIVLHEIRVPRTALLPGAMSFDAANVLLKDSRAWVGWQAVGAQQAVLDILRDYSLERMQFGKPLASFQVIQQSMAEIAGNLAASSAMMVQMARLQETGELEMMHAAIAKSTATRLGRQSALLARDALGGNGLLSDYEISKVLGDLEAIYTYEGSYHINSLIVSRALTGVSAFV